MDRGTAAAPLRVVLLCKTLGDRQSGEWTRANAPWALGAFCLRRHVETLPELAARVAIEVRSYPRDAPPELILDEILRLAPDVVGLTCQPWNYGDHVTLSRLVKRLLPGVRVWHGGPMVVHRAEYLARLGPGVVDLVVEGEGEQPFAELLRHLLDGAPALDTIGGIGWHDAAGGAHVTPDRPLPDVQKLPPLMTAPVLDALGSYVLYETTRGCPFRCSFCNWGSQKAKLRTRDRAVIEADLAAILARPEVRHLWLTDAGLDISVEHVLFLAACIKKHKKHPVHVSGYVFLLHRDLSYVRELVGAFDTLQLGLQTANEHTLSEMGRKALSVERFDHILDAVLPHYPDLRVDLIYGLPGIGPDELRSSLRFLLGKGIWLINLYRLVAIPGTEMGDQRDKYGIVADPDYPFNVYESAGCSVRDLFEMQQLKVNMDALRALFGRGAYARAAAAGVDLLDFASRVHEAVPRFNFRTDYGLEVDQELADDLVLDLRRAADAFARSDAERAVVGELFDRAYGPRAHARAPDEPRRIRLAPGAAPGSGDAPPPRAARATSAPSDALRGLSVALATAVGGFPTPLTAERARELWAAYRADGLCPERWGVHVHVPFCQSICTYCDCATEALADPGQVARYLEYLEAEVAFFDGALGHDLDRLYVGGGTPNLLEPAELERLLATVTRHHRFGAGALVCLEGHPLHSSRDKLAVARAHGVNRVSFGVQSHAPEVLRRVNRGGQRPEHVAAAVRDAFLVGIAEVNLDYIHGLGDEPLASTLEGVRAGLALGPSTLCVQLLNDSHFAAPYRDDEHRRRVAREFRELGLWLADAVAARAPGYDVGFRPDTVVLYRRDLARDWHTHLEDFSARDRTRRTTLGYGRHAQSTLFGRLVYQNQERSGRFDPRAPSYAARATTPALECASDLVSELERTRVADLAPLRSAYGADTVAALEPWLARLVDHGHLERAGDVVRDVALAPAAVAWLLGHLAEPAAPAAAVEPLGSVAVTEPASAWRICFERAREGAPYFGVARGVGVYYQAEPSAKLDPERTRRIMQAVLEHAGGLLGGGTAPGEVAQHVAAFLEARLGARGIHARLESAVRKRNRLTVLAPSG
ncbi:MAG: radical SAM protein [Myxococcales bacterium]|nr:radical SAM protein [Myxococcales bacterium]